MGGDVEGSKVTRVVLTRGDLLHLKPPRNSVRFEADAGDVAALLKRRGLNLRKDFTVWTDLKTGNRIYEQE